MDGLIHEILIWKHIQTEKVADYKYLLNELLSLGYMVLSVTIDGKRGVSNVFRGYPVQDVSFPSETDCTEIYYSASQT